MTTDEISSGELIKIMNKPPLERWKKYNEYLKRRVPATAEENSQIAAIRDAREACIFDEGEPDYPDYLGSINQLDSLLSAYVENYSSSSSSDKIKLILDLLRLIDLNDASGTKEYINMIIVRVEALIGDLIERLKAHEAKMAREQTARRSNKHKK